MDTHKENAAIEAPAVLAADEVDIFEDGVGGWRQEGVEGDVGVEDYGVAIDPAMWEVSFACEKEGPRVKGVVRKI